MPHIHIQFTCCVETRGLKECPVLAQSAIYLILFRTNKQYFSTSCEAWGWLKPKDAGVCNSRLSNLNSRIGWGKTINRICATGEYLILFYMYNIFNTEVQWQFFFYFPLLLNIAEAGDFRFKFCYQRMHWCTHLMMILYHFYADWLHFELVEVIVFGWIAVVFIRLVCNLRIVWCEIFCGSACFCGMSLL